VPRNGFPPHKLLSPTLFKILLTYLDRSQLKKVWHTTEIPNTGEEVDFTVQAVPGSKETENRVIYLVVVHLYY